MIDGGVRCLLAAADLRRERPVEVRGSHGVGAQAAESRTRVGRRFEQDPRRAADAVPIAESRTRVGSRFEGSRGRNRSIGVPARADPPVNSPTIRLLDLTVAGNGFPGADPVAVEIFGLVRRDIVDVTPEVVN